MLDRNYSTKLLFIYIVGICANCRKKLSKLCIHKLTTKDDNYVETSAERIRKSSRLAYGKPISYDDLLATPASPPISQGISAFETPGYHPEPYKRVLFRGENVSLQKLNEFLASRDNSPVRYCARENWSEAADRTKREHVRKIKQSVTAVIETIAPGQADKVWADMKLTGNLDSQFNVNSLSYVESDTSLNALAAAYREAETRTTKIQILSIIVDTFSQQHIQASLPEATKYQLTQAKKHLLSHGRGQPMPAIPKYRVGLTMPKIEHFIGFISTPHFVQDVAHGTRTLRLSSGETINMPNVIRNIISARIIKQYVAYCEETNFKHLSERELYRVLKFCPAQQKKALQGLDNISADGLRGVEMLSEIIKKLGERGKSQSWVREVQNKLHSYKSYLKNDYRLHISSSSRCADHCSVFALSDPKNKCFSQNCKHVHDMECENCCLCKQLEQSIKSALSDKDVIFYSGDEKDDMSHDVKVCFDAIVAWKCHLLRAVHQDKARQDSLDALDSSIVFVTQDFAMKYLPRSFKETQMEWFGKRGISWHISYCVRQVKPQEYQVSVYSHVFRQSISQNSETVAAVMLHTLQEEKSRHPEITAASYRSDCAGAYASGGLLVPVRYIGGLTGISIKRYDFSEPQAGKGPCDRSSAHQKAHVNRCLNEGNDMTSASHIKKALEMHGGVQGVIPYVVEMPGTVKESSIPRIPDVSLLHNYEYLKEGLKVWKAYNIGEGKLLSWQTLEKEGTVRPLTLRDLESTLQEPITSVPCSKTKKRDANKPKAPPSKEKQESEGGLFCCPEPGCVKEYIKLGNLEKHIASEKHTYKEVNEPLGDRVMRKWAEQFEKISLHDNPSSKEVSQEQVPTSMDTTSKKGWALKASKKVVRFPEKVKNYLREKFDAGIATGHKEDPVQVSSDMRCARDELGRRIFSADECLKPQQIRSFFSRLSAARKAGIKNPDDLSDDLINDVEKDLESEEHEMAISQLRGVILNEVTEKHPIYYDRFNLCDLHKQNKLRKKFSIDMLVRICEHFGLDVSNVSRTRKEGFIECIKELIESCSCSI